MSSNVVSPKGPAYILALLLFAFDLYLKFCNKMKVAGDIFTSLWPHSAPIPFTPCKANHYFLVHFFTEMIFLRLLPFYIRPFVMIFSFLDIPQLIPCKWFNLPYRAHVATSHVRNLSVYKKCFHKHKYLSRKQIFRIVTNFEQYGTIGDRRKDTPIRQRVGNIEKEDYYRGDFNEISKEYV